MSEATVDKALDKDKIVQNLFTNTLSGNIAKGSEDILTSLKVWAAKVVGDYTGEKAAEIGASIAQNQFGRNEHQAAVIGRRVENLWRLGLPMVTGSLRSFKNIHSDLSHYGNLKTQFSPAIGVHHPSNWGYATFFNTDLEVVRNARSSAAKKLKNGLKAELAAGIALLPVAVSSYVDKLIDDVHRVGQNRDKGKIKPASENNELDRIRYRSAEKVESTLRKWIDKVDPDNFDNPSVATRTGMDMLAQVLTGQDIDHYTGSSGPYTLLSNVKHGLLGKYDIAGGGVASFLRRIVGVKGEDAFNQPSADKMIFALEKAVKKSPSLSRVAGLPGQQSGENTPLEKYIENIFHQHQKDCRREAIPDSAADDLKAACKLISEAMTDPNRRLHPQALVLLVDRKHGILKHENGRVTDVAAAEDVSMRLQQMLARSPGMSLRKQQNAQRYFEERIFTQEDFVASWNGLTDDEKLVWSTFFPPEILRTVENSDEELARLDNKGNEFWRETVEATLEELQKLNSSDMKDLGLNSKQVDVIRDLIKSHIKGNGEEIDNKRQEAMDLTAQIGVAMDRDRPGFLHKILERATEKKEHKRRLKQREDDKSFAEQVEAKETKSKSAGAKKETQVAHS